MSKIHEEYMKELNEAWLVHTSPKKDDAPTVISTFAGTGGSSLGYSMAGFKELLAVEWDDHAVKSFRRNFPDVDVYHGDIAKISAEEVLSRTGLKQGELDVFDGSPPCQGFSTAGRRDDDDGRNQLFKEFVRLIEGLQPKVFVMENVPGMIHGKMANTFKIAIAMLRSAGYDVKAKVHRATWYGVPQNRQRIIFIGVRVDLSINSSHPLPTSSQEIPSGLAMIGADNSVAEELSDDYGKLGVIMAPGKKTHHYVGVGFTACKIDPNKPSTTICKSTSGKGFCTMMHFSEPRSVSIGEAKRLSSFPDQFVLEGTYQEQWARLGNCVPPFMIRAVANHIRKEILDV